MFTVKPIGAGTVERFKAQLIAKGFIKTYRFNYKETFASIAKINVLKILLPYAANIG